MSPKTYSLWIGRTQQLFRFLLKETNSRQLHREKPLSFSSWKNVSQDLFTLSRENSATYCFLWKETNSKLLFYCRNQLTRTLLIVNFFIVLGRLVESMKMADLAFNFSQTDSTTYRKTDLAISFSLIDWQAGWLRVPVKRQTLPSNPRWLKDFRKKLAQSIKIHEKTVTVQF